jgi:hypothetical protein
MGVEISKNIIWSSCVVSISIDRSLKSLEISERLRSVLEVNFQENPSKGKRCRREGVLAPILSAH